VRKTLKMKKAEWERTSQIPGIVRSAILPMVRGVWIEKLPSRRQLEAGIRLRLRSKWRWNQIQVEWPSRELEVAEVLMEKEDRSFLTVVVWPWKAKKVEVPFTVHGLELRTDDGEEHYPEDSDSGDYDSNSYASVGDDAKGYEDEYDDHFERAFGEHAPTKRERQLEEWEWQFTQQWARSKRA